MTEENSNTPQATWTEGGPVESMSGDDAKAEIKSIERDPSFAGDGKMDYWSRQNMIKRRDALYRHASGEDGEKPYNSMEDTLRTQGITKESLESDQEKFAERDSRESKSKAMDTLTTYFGGTDEAIKEVEAARGILDRFAKPEDLVFLEESGLGNDPELIQKLSEIARIFKEGAKK